MRRLFLFLLLLSVSFAFDRGDFVLDHVETDFGHGCQYYNVTNKLAISAEAAKPTATIADKTSDVRNEAWEYLAIEERSRLVHDYDWDCQTAIDKNGTEYEECVDHGTDRLEYYDVEVWDPLDNTHIFDALKTTQVRYCADFDMKAMPEGGWGVEIDMIPSFGGFSYPEYAWWNATWERCMQINISDGSGFGTGYAHHIILNDSVFNYSNAQSDLDDLRFLEGNCTDPSGSVLAQFNESVNPAGNSEIWFRTASAFDSVDSVAMYYNNTGAPSIWNIAATFILGDDFDDGSLNTTLWNDSSQITGGSTPPSPNELNGVINLDTTEGDGINRRASISTHNGFDSTRNSTHGFAIHAEGITWDSVNTGYRGAVTIMEYGPYRVDGTYATVTNHSLFYLLEGWTADDAQIQLFDDGFVTLDTENQDTNMFSYDLVTSVFDDNITVDDGTNILTTINDTGFHGNTTSNLSLWAGGGTSVKSNMNVSYVFVRKAMVTEPTYSFGPEQDFTPNESNISSCQTLDTPDHQYTLTQNISTSGTCLTVDDDNITIDCFGFAIIGDGTGEGVLTTYPDTTVRNCLITDFNEGIKGWTSASDNLNATNNTIWNMAYSGIALDANDGAYVYNNTVYDAGSFALFIYNNATNAVVDENILHSTPYGVYASEASSLDMDDIEIYNSSTTGLYIKDNLGCNIAAAHLYNNTEDLRVNISEIASYTLNLTNIIFDSAGGAYSDYTNLSMNDTVMNSTTDEYLMKYATLPSTPPGDTEDIGSWLNITDVRGTPTLASLVWHYTAAQASAVNENTLDMYKWTGSAWSDVTDTLDATANTLTVTSLSSFSDFGPIAEPDFKVNGTLANSSETDVQTLYISLVSAVGTIDTYNLTAYYNGTAVLELIGVAAVDSTIHRQVNVTAPLVGTNLTNIPWNLSASVDVAGSNYDDTDEGNQSVELWYYFDNYTFAADAAYTVEERNNYTISLARPANSPENVTYDSFLYALEDCTWVYANGTEANNTCENTLVQDYWYDMSTLPSHSQEDGLIYSDIWLNVSYDISFDATTESTSSKTITGTWNASREYFVWLVEIDNGTIDGADNISTWLNVSFYYEANLTATTGDSVASSYTVTFPDGETKNFTISYSGTLDNATIRGYPDFYTATISSTEVYSKSGFTTRSRFMTLASTDLSEQQNTSIYFLDDADATYGLVIVHDNGDPVVGAVVQLQKFYSEESMYITVDERYTNADGKAASYIDADAYYHFNVIDGDDASVLYQSDSPEQFIIEDSVYTVTINIADNDAIDLITPYLSASCYGNATANAIIFSYLDGTGITDTIRFLAYRANSTTPVCNQSITASSGSYTCSLSSPENLSAYVYTCEVWHEASPWWLDLVDIIDERSLTGVDGWVIVAMVMVAGLVGAAFHLSIGIGLAGISLFAIDALGIYALGYDVTLPIMTVGLVLAYLSARRD